LETSFEDSTRRPKENPENCLANYIPILFEFANFEIEPNGRMDMILFRGNG